MRGDCGLALRWWKFSFFELRSLTVFSPVSKGCLRYYSALPTTTAEAGPLH